MTNKYLRYIWLLFNHSILFNLLSHSFLIAQFKLSLLFMKFCTALKYFKKSLSTSNIKYIQSCQKLVNINSEEIHNVKKMGENWSWGRKRHTCLNIKLFHDLLLHFSHLQKCLIFYQPNSSKQKFQCRRCGTFVWILSFKLK